MSDDAGSAGWSECARLGAGRCFEPRWRQVVTAPLPPASWVSLRATRVRPPPAGDPASPAVPHTFLTVVPIRTVPDRRPPYRHDPLQTAAIPRPITSLALPYTTRVPWATTHDHPKQSYAVEMAPHWQIEVLDIDPCPHVALPRLTASSGGRTRS